MRSRAEDAADVEGVASSTRSLAQARGWTKATLPASPDRGFPSTMSTPVPMKRRTSLTTSSDSKQTWWSPSPRLSRNRLTPVSVPSSGAITSTSAVPHARSAARTPWSARSAERRTGSSSVSRQKPSAASRFRTTTATWWSRVITGSPYPTHRRLQSARGRRHGTPYARRSRRSETVDTGRENPLRARSPTGSTSTRSSTAATTLLAASTWPGPASPHRRAARFVTVPMAP